ncbi:LTA synthase family protein [Streptococcus sp. 19428wC2_LYSM12]|nr:LTA synthase family protein [Streptococcus sp. 19428wC2_LYSM12]
MKKIKQYLQEINWKQNVHILVLCAAVLSIVLYHITDRALEDVNLTSSVKQFQEILFFLQGLGIIVLGIYLSRSLNKWFYFKFSVQVIIYLLVSYGVYITRQLNNEKFQMWNFSKNQFWEWHALPILGWIFLVAVLYKYLLEASSMSSVEAETNKLVSPSNWVVHFILPILIFSDSKLSLTIMQNITGLLDDSQVDRYVVLFLPNLIIAMVGSILLSFMFFKAIELLRQNKASVSLSIITSFVMALVINYYLQLGVQDDSALLDKFIFEGATLYQILFFVVFYLLVYVLINRYVLSTLLLISFSTIIAVANYLKESMRSEPLLITDFVWIQDTNLILSFVDKQYFVYLLGMIVLPIILYVVLRKRVLVNPIFGKKRYRVLVFAALVTLVVSVFAVFKTEENAKVIPGIPVVSKLNNWQDIEWFGFSVNARYKSVAYVWTKQLTKKVMEKPDGYSQEAIDQIAQKYTDVAEKINRNRTENISNQTVIYILSESLANPAYVDGVSISQEVLPNIQLLKQDTTSGLMISDGYGGGTANMEFQSLTGLPFFNYSPSVSVLYTEVVPKMKVFPSISDHFASENRLVLHPSGANNYSRKNIYKRLGFERLIFASDTNETFKNQEKVGVSMSDEAVYENILDNIDPSKNQFFSVITMQNHAPWSVGNPVEVTASGQDFTAEENDKLTEYSRLLTYTDQATQKFIEALSNVDKNITVVFYGDHLPGFYPTKVFENNPDSKFETDYFIWSNHNTKKLDQFPLVRSNDLTAELLQHTDSKVSPYYALLTFLLNQATIGNVDSDISIIQAQADLRMLQYDISLGKGYIQKNKDFFVIGDK